MCMQEQYLSTQVEAPHGFALFTHSPWGGLEHLVENIGKISLLPSRGSPQADIKAERVGMVWAEFVTTSIDSLPTSKLN